MDLRVIDRGGSVSGRNSAFSQAMALNPNGIIINGFGPVEQKVAVEAARAASIALVSWHVTSANGPHDALGMKEAIGALGGTVLEYVDTPLAETSIRMPQLTMSLLQRYGEHWTHSLAIHDLDFDFMAPSFAAAGRSNDDAPASVAAADGSQAAYQRVRAGEYQAVTVAEPLNLQGRQMIYDINRAFAGEIWSGFQSPLHVAILDIIEFDGGPVVKFDPGNGYRDEYKKIWGVMENLKGRALNPPF